MRTITPHPYTPWYCLLSFVMCARHDSWRDLNSSPASSPLLMEGLFLSPRRVDFYRPRVNDRDPTG